jgi:hypothetical protein
MKEFTLNRLFHGISLKDLDALIFESDFFVQAQLDRGASDITCTSWIKVTPMTMTNENGTPASRKCRMDD